MLSEEKKKRLLELINEAEANGETHDFIQNELIPAFKSRHDTLETKKPEVKTEPEIEKAEPIWSKSGIPKKENIVPYYKEGAKNLLENPYETIFPSAASVKGSRFVTAVKRNVLGALDVLSIPDRAIDYLSGGAFERGKETINEGINSLPGKGYVSGSIKNLLRSGADIATSPTSYVGYGAIKKAITKETPESISRSLAKQTGLDKTIQQGFDKGIKPTVKNKSSYSKMSGFNKKGNEAVRTIAERKDLINLVDETGESIPYPRNSAEFAQAIEKTKESIFSQYNDMAVAAGDAGARFDSKPVINKIDKLINKKSTPGEVVNAAKRVRSDIVKLNGASPAEVQDAIKYYNKSLEGYYAGRSVSQANAEVNGSVANLLRKQIDDKIESAAGSGYQELKNKYGALKSIEKEVNHRAIVNARKNNKGLADLTDVFTTGDLFAGVITQNPALIVRGATGRVIKGAIKKVNDPDRYISKMFREAYKEYSGVPYSWTSHTPERSIFANISENLQSSPAYERYGIKPEADYIARQAQKNATGNAIRSIRPKVTESQEKIESMRRYLAGRDPQYGNLNNLIIRR